MSIVGDVSPSRRRTRTLPGFNFALVGAYAVFVAAIGFTGAVVAGFVP